MESLPSLQSLHNAISHENAVEAEEELLSVITHLLVCAIEDPGIPNPNRHTTLLGQTLRQADITHQNVSEILRIYLYSVATGEVRQATGINLEREKCGRFVDLHHQAQNSEVLDEKQCSKNTQFYEALHDNERYKLSESLKDKPYVALNPTVKAKILAMLCNDLLLNKAVCKQIENGLESQAVLKKEKFLLDNKVRKYKSLLLRKQRIEQYEKSQQNLKKEALEESQSVDKVDLVDDKAEVKSVKGDETLSPSKTPEKAIPSKPDDSLRKSNIPDEKIDEDNASEEESEDLDEDEDATMTSEEVQKKLEKILEQSFQTKQQLQKSLSSLRGKHYGQDRYWRRYWYLPKCGGIYVEGLESAESEILNYQSKLDDCASKASSIKLEDIPEDEKINLIKDTISEPEEEKSSNATEDVNEQEFDEESVDKYKHIGQVIKNTSVNICQPMKPENHEDFDIEDSIPTAILVQKGNKLDDSKFVEINHVVPSNPMQKVEEEQKQNNEKIEIKNEKDIKVKIENDGLNDTKDGISINSESLNNGDDIKSENIKSFKMEPLLSKWFSLVDPEIPLYTPDCPLIPCQVEMFRNIQCKDDIIMHGHQWEIQNNLHFYNPKLYYENNENEIEFKNDSVLSTSGLDLLMIDKALSDNKQDNLSKKTVANCIENGDVKKLITPEDPLNGKVFYDQCHNFSLPPIQNMTINNLSVFLQCENLNAAQMTPEDQEAVDEVKRNGVKQPAESILVPKDLRFGWFKINEIEDMNNIIKSLHTKGVREKILRQNLLSALSESIDLTCPCPVSNARAPPPPNGYIEPEAFIAWNPRIAKRVEQQLLDQVEGLEDKIANASMQVKGWNVPQRDNESESDILENIDINMIKDRIVNLEAAIERRYLKPPLGNK